MAEYRFFRLNTSGIIDAAERVRFEADGEALDFARDFSKGGAVEVWRGDQRLAKMPPQRVDVQRFVAASANAATKWRRHIAI